jgi:AraC-like DNA-binding protein
MESFFFHLERRRYRKRFLHSRGHGGWERVDVSSGLLYLHGTFPGGGEGEPICYRDRMAMMLLVPRGEVRLHDALAGVDVRVREGEAALLLSTRQDLRPAFAPGTKFFWLCVADFHLERYLSGRPGEAVDLLCGALRGERSLERLQVQALDALSLYLIGRITEVSEEEPLAGIRAEHRVNELLIHRLSLWERPREDLDPRDRELAERARAVLLRRFADPPTIPELARLCATNDFRLKKLFRRVYGTTIHDYVRRLRLEEANLLLRSGELSVGEIARRVGYRHQGHFSRLFFEHYGLYPKELAGKSSF